ncbi:hypothetical protein V5799_007115 [Amblyomma americanum]|uniref:Uncharacterized protein n=1 Tax=Amblyomma americanum TaxID=6943 RepID=A0AAQ4DUG3_AMBAM
MGWHPPQSCDAAVVFEDAELSGEALRTLSVPLTERFQVQFGDKILRQMKAVDLSSRRRGHECQSALALRGDGWCGAGYMAATMSGTKEQSVNTWRASLCPSNQCCRDFDFLSKHNIRYGPLTADA